MQHFLYIYNQDLCCQTLLLPVFIIYDGNCYGLPYYQEYIYTLDTINWELLIQI